MTGQMDAAVALCKLFELSAMRPFAGDDESGIAGCRLYCFAYSLCLSAFKTIGLNG